MRSWPRSPATPRRPSTSRPDRWAAAVVPRPTQLEREPRDEPRQLASGASFCWPCRWPFSGCSSSGRCSVRSTTASPTGTASTATTIYVGFDNFAKIYTDRLFYNAAINTAIWMVAAIILPTAAGAGPGAADRQPGAGRAGVQDDLLPADLPVGRGRRPDLDLDLPARLGASEHRHRARSPASRFNYAWLAKPDSALGSVIVAWSWQQTGLSMVIYLAGLTAIPSDLLEVCEIEGVDHLAAHPHRDPAAADAPPPWS